MKCLSLKQPFAELLATGKKTVELRNWNTNFRGEFIIHASRSIDDKACSYPIALPERLYLVLVCGELP